MQQLTRFNRHSASRGPSAIAEPLVGMRVATQDSYCVSHGSMDPPTKTETSGGGVMNLEKFRLLLRHGRPPQQLLSFCFAVSQVDLARSMNAWHAVETASSTFVLCHGSGVSELDREGQVLRSSQYHLFHPCHLAVVDGA